MMPFRDHEARMTRGIASRADRTCMLLIVMICVLSMLQVTLAAERSRTIGDLPSREVEVRPDPPGDVLTQQAIEQYRRFLELEGQHEQLRAEAMRRLGDLQLELQVEEGELPQDDSLDVFSGLPLDEAVQLYEGLLATHPGHDRNDTVLYQLARAHEIQGRAEQALRVLDQLVAQHPRSPWYVEAQFRRGEMLFSFSRHREAETAYEAVIDAGTTTGFFDQALYKLGWPLFRQRRDEPAVATFLRLLDRLLVDVDGWRLRSDEQLGRAQLELAEDAMRAVATTYLEMEGADSLDAALQVRGDPLYVHLLYEALGELYLEKERFQDAALAFDAFPNVAQKPIHRRHCRSAASRPTSVAGLLRW